MSVRRWSDQDKPILWDHFWVTNNQDRHPIKNKRPIIDHITDIRPFFFTTTSFVLKNIAQRLTSRTVYCCCCRCRCFRFYRNVWINWNVPNQQPICAILHNNCLATDSKKIIWNSINMRGVNCEYRIDIVEITIIDWENRRKKNRAVIFIIISA